MDIINTIQNLLPSFEIRFILILEILLALILIELVPLFLKKIQKIYLITTLTICTVVLATNYILLFTQPIAQELARNLNTTVISLVILSVLLITKIIIFVLGLKEQKKKLLKIINIIIPIKTILFLLLILSFTLFQRPYAYNTTSTEENVLAVDQSITISFTSPVKTTNLKVNLSPDQEKKVEYKYFLGIPSLVTEITVTPIINFPPDTPVIVYITGIQTLAPFTKLHEESIEFKSPSSPKVLGTSIDQQTENVAINKDITLNLDTNDQNFVKWNITVEPETAFNIVRNSTKEVLLDLEDLKQGTQYTISIYQSILSYNTQTKEEISTEEETLIKTITFTTTPQPGIKSFNRKDTVLSNSEPVRIEFENPLDLTDINQYFSISPSIEGSISTDDSKKILIFSPKGEFAKGKTYTITLKKGLKTELGGYLESDITLSFSTPGETLVTSMYPSNKSTNINTTLKYVSVSFNQPVDKTSAQEHFSISPSIGGSFSWSGYTMYYNFSNNLGYNAQYTTSVSSGINSLYGNPSTRSYSSSFTTKIETYILNVPQYYQTEKFTCNLAATRMVLAYRGISSTESGIRSWIGIGENPNTHWVTDYGTHAPNISRYMNSRGRSTAVKTGWSAAGLAQEIKNGNPSVLYMYNNYTQPRGTITLPGGYTGYNGMHSEVAVGYTGSVDNPTSIITNDPWRGRRYLSISTLNSLWSYLNYTAVVVY